MVFMVTTLSVCFYLHATSYPACTQVNDSECNSLELTVSGSGYTVMGYAVFGGPTLTGRINFVSRYNGRSRCNLI